jgi:carbamoyl-phosphate synthase large subunit
MEIVYNEKELRRYMNEAQEVSSDSPLLLDHFLDNAIEVDIDAVCDGKTILIGGIMEHIEQAGVHSGDSACCLPAHSLSPQILDSLRDQMKKLALELGVIGLMNAQFAIQNNEVYILEVNPRASRTVPFVSKAIGLPLAKIAASCMVGISLSEQNAEHELLPRYYTVKQPVFPFVKFPGVDPILGPEMRSTGEVMGVGNSFEEAFAKAQLGADKPIPRGGTAFISVRDADKPRVIGLAKELIQQGFKIVATSGTARALQEADVNCTLINKVNEGRPHIVDLLKNDEIDFIVNTTEGEQAITDSYAIRRNAVQHKVCYFTTIAGGIAACSSLQHETFDSVIRLQDLH